MSKLVLVVLVTIGHLSIASADSPYTVLANAKAKWTYDVVKGKKHKSTGQTATIAVTAVHTVGAYTVIELATTLPQKFSVTQGTWIVGPDGLREVLYFSTDEVGYTEEHVKSAYDEHYVPRAYLQPTPAVKKKLRWKLERFGDEDRTYKVTGSISKPDAHTWRTAWKGGYSIPETGANVDYSWSTDFDPAVGFTQICTETDVCLQLATP